MVTAAPFGGLGLTICYDVRFPYLYQQLVDLGAAPTVVARNTLVTLAYRRGNIELTTLGRALDHAGLHQPVRVVNVDSRLTVVGTVAGPGMVRIGAPGG